jgi:hypothetical protein
MTPVVICVCAAIAGASNRINTRLAAKVGNRGKLRKRGVRILVS